MEEDSASDWDSMSEAAPVPEMKEPQKHAPTRKENRKTPPFDFRDEVQASREKTSSSARVPGREKPRRSGAYQPSPSSAEDAEKFGSPAAAAVHGKRNSNPGRRNSNPGSVQSPNGSSLSGNSHSMATVRSNTNSNSGRAEARSAGTRNKLRKLKEKEAKKTKEGDQFSSVEKAISNGPRNHHPRTHHARLPYPPPPKENGGYNDDEAIEVEGGEEEEEEEERRREKEGGIDNYAYQDEFYLEERPDSSNPEFGGNFERTGFGGKNPRPRPDERIELLRFEEPVGRYFQVGHQSQGVWADKLLPDAADCCNWCLAEVFGILQIPFVMVFILLGQITLCLIQSTLRPCSDYIFKPVLVHVHNQLLVPICGLGHNICSLCTQSIRPICQLWADSCCPRQRKGGEEEGRIISMQGVKIV